jgi:hypothetical protein
MTHRTSQLRTRFLALLCLVALACAGIAAAQLPAPGAAWQFDVTGFIQQATLGGAGCTAAGAPSAGALACGTIVVNGHVITVPANTVVMFPANQLGWGEVFSLAPQPYRGLSLSGLATSDVPTPLTTYEAHVVGNVVPAAGALPGVGTYIAGLISISQHGLNSGAGYITSIAQVTNPATGLTEMELGVATGTTPALTRVRINDPVIPALGTGRYTQGQSPDVRFTSDPDNPTITAGTGFPQCLYSADVAQCPQANRPTVVGGGFAGQFYTQTGFLNPLTGVRIPPGGGFPDASVMAPLEIGDYVTFAGNLVQDCAAGCPNGQTGGPWPLAPGGVYISAHTITSNIAIWTQPRTASDPTPKDPAYARIDVSLIGTGGLNVLGAAEASIRTRFEGFTTDKSRTMHMFGIDVPQPPGTDRDWGTIGVDPGPPKGVAQGRWRFRPPCVAFGTDPNTLKAIDKQCIMNQADTFLPATRELRAVLEVPACPVSGADPVIGIACVAGTPAVQASRTPLANGLIPGQYHAPIQDYILAENIPGTVVIPVDFNSIPFLAQGGYASTSNSTPSGALNPWPGTLIPAPGCTPASAAPGGPYQVASGGTVTLSGTAGGTTPTFLWTVVSGGGSFTAGSTTLTPTFSAPAVLATTTVTVNLAVTACNSTVNSPATITVNAPLAPTATVPAPITVLSGTPVSLKGTGVDPNVPALALTFAWTQTNTGAAGVPTVSPLTCGPAASPITCTLNFVPTLPVGGASATIQLQGLTTNSAGVSSVAASTSVTVLPPSAALSITSVEYRTTAKRLIINASDTTVSPTLVLKLQPYVTSTGVTYNPDPAAGGLGNTFINNGAGLYLLDISGAPAPVCGNTTGAYATPCRIAAITVTASDGGTASSVVTKIRQ